jgi:hypothetical protein
MASSIIDGTNIDTSVITYSPIKANPTGGKVVNVSNKLFRESLTISTPLMLTWGAQEGLTQGTKLPTGKFSLSLQFPSKEFETPETSAFLQQMKILEQKIREDALINSKEWFGKQHKSQDVVDELFNPMLRYPKDKTTGETDYSKSPTLSVKLPCWKADQWQTEIYDEEGNPLFIKGTPGVPMTFLAPKTHLIGLIQCGGLWFVNGKFAITWNLKQAVVQKPRVSAIASGVCYLKPKTADVEKLKLLPPPETAVDTFEETVAVVDSDDETDPHYAATELDHSALRALTEASPPPSLAPLEPISLVTSSSSEDVVYLSSQETTASVLGKRDSAAPEEVKKAKKLVTSKKPKENKE